MKNPSEKDGKPSLEADLSVCKFLNMLVLFWLMKMLITSQDTRKLVYNFSWHVRGCDILSGALT